ncbi:MAG: hypothetical protein JNL10_01965 [Verrucomicrobiales bacterium]|nr:hypothetical protein [Verrucomicrobiales bacterium]
MSSIATDLALARECALAAGELLCGEFHRGSSVNSARGKDIKLAADLLAEEAILSRLRTHSPHPILSEEAGEDAGFGAAGLRWVVDPLDGTYNFSRRLPLCCVSIGLCDGDRPVLGVIHDFLGGVTYAGAIGLGATRNGEPMSVSTVADRAAAVICTGFPSGRSYDDASLLAFVRKTQQYKKVRLLGSAALSLALVAAGHAEVYHEEGINFWDVAAGLALVAAAGGTFQTRAAGGRWQFEVIATNGRVSAS